MGIKAALPNVQKHREVAKMKRQRDKAQMKKWIKTPQKELSDTEIANLSDAQFKALVGDQDAHRIGGIWSKIS